MRSWGGVVGEGRRESFGTRRAGIARGFLGFRLLRSEFGFGARRGEKESLTVPAVLLSSTLDELGGLERRGGRRGGAAR